jgi:hypothetical protein
MGVGWVAQVTLQPCNESIVMAEFAVNPHRVDPWKNFKFRLKWDGR